MGKYAFYMYSVTYSGLLYIMCYFKTEHLFTVKKKKKKNLCLQTQVFLFFIFFLSFHFFLSFFLYVIFLIMSYSDIIIQIQKSIHILEIF